MDWVDSTVFEILKFLAPGFIAAWILYALTAERHLSDLQRVIQALIFSIFVKIGVDLIEWGLGLIGRWKNFGVWDADAELTWSVLAATGFGFLLSWLVNTDRLYRWLRQLKITTQTSRPSVWYGTFSDHQDTYVVLHLQDDRRVQGWPAEWPSVPGEGHIKLEDPIWLDAIDGKVRQTALLGNTFILFSLSDVRWIEFQPKQPANDSELAEKRH